MKMITDLYSDPCWDLPHAVAGVDLPDVGTIKQPLDRAIAAKTTVPVSNQQRTGASNDRSALRQTVTTATREVKSDRPNCIYKFSVQINCRRASTSLNLLRLRSTDMERVNNLVIDLRQCWRDRANADRCFYYRSFSRPIALIFIF